IVSLERGFGQHAVDILKRNAGLFAYALAGSAVGAYADLSRDDGGVFPQWASVLPDCGAAIRSSSQVPEEAFLQHDPLAPLCPWMHFQSGCFCIRVSSRGPAVLTDSRTTRATVSNSRHRNTEWLLATAALVGE